MVNVSNAVMFKNIEDYARKSLFLSIFFIGVKYI